MPELFYCNLPRVEDPVNRILFCAICIITILKIRKNREKINFCHSLYYFGENYVIIKKIFRKIFNYFLHFIYCKPDLACDVGE